MSRRLKSDLGRSTADSIEVRGLNLADDLIGKVSLGDVAYLELTGRLPDARESVVFNALVVTLVEHGVTPSAIAARMTYFGAPESLQAAVAAGLLGLGDRFGGSIEQAARMLQEALAGPERPAGLQEVATKIVSEHRASRRIIPGLGHPTHTHVDPRTPRLFQVAADNGFSGSHVALMQAVGVAAEKAYGRELPVNATGAIAAIAGDMGLSWRVCRGLAVMARAIGLVAHLQEEMADPMAPEIWARVEREASGDAGSGSV